MFKVLFIALLLYFFVRAVRNLFRAALGGQAPPPPVQERGWEHFFRQQPPPPVPPSPPQERVQDPRAKPDIEDATWEDIS